jgi:putative transposase
MALDYSALLALVSQLKDTDLTDRIRVATQRFNHELIDAQAAEMIGALPIGKTLNHSLVYTEVKRSEG